ncbi:MAG: hypothetical protein JNM76_07895 [Betaproteobacteria bacterium]|nr:hypothetical protein [Betaproteobacteria bacterium]
MTASSDSGPLALSLLKWPVLALALGLVASALFVGGSFAYLRHEQNAEKMSQRNLREAQARIGNANKEIQDLLASVDIYNRMLERGLFSEPSRLVWIESVAALKSKHQLVALDYELSARQTASLAAGDAFPSIEIHGSPVQMNMQALHDGDLIGFIRELPTLAPGAFPMDRCIMKLKPEVTGAPLTPRIDAQCSFTWVTLVDKRPAAPMPPSVAPKTVAVKRNP